MCTPKVIQYDGVKHCHDWLQDAARWAQSDPEVAGLMLDRDPGTLQRYTSAVYFLVRLQPGTSGTDQPIDRPHAADILEAFRYILNILDRHGVNNDTYRDTDILKRYRRMFQAAYYHAETLKHPGMIRAMPEYLPAADTTQT